MHPKLHEFPATPIREAHTALAVHYGLNWYPVVSFGGRNCFVSSVQRVWGGKGRKYYNSFSVHFLDGKIEQIPAAKFNKLVKAVEIELSDLGL